MVVAVPVRTFCVNVRWTETVRLVNLSTSDSGVYRCEAVTQDKVERKERELVVLPVLPTKVEPALTNMNGSMVTLRAEEEFTLTCALSGRPAPITAWTRDGQPVPPSNFVEDLGSSLRIKYLRRHGLFKSK